MWFFLLAILLSVLSVMLESVASIRAHYKVEAFGRRVVFYSIVYGGVCRQTLLC